MRNPILALALIATVGTIALLGVIRPVHASVVPATLDDLIAKADAIVIGTVEAVEWLPDHRGRHARVLIEQALKGTPGEKLVVRIPQTRFICDVTDANSGERVLLFLGRGALGPTGQEWHILHAGRGRQVIDKGDNVRFFDVYLPEPSMPDATRRQWGGVVPLSLVVKYIAAKRPNDSPSRGRKRK